MYKKRLLAVAAVLATAALPAHAGAEFQGSSSTSIRLRGYVPVICHVNVSADVGVMAADGTVDLGTAREFCNAPHGYQVLVDHPRDLEGAALITDGQRIPLSASGVTVLSDVGHADIRQVSLGADLGRDPSRFRSINIRIEAKI